MNKFTITVEIFNILLSGIDKSISIKFGKDIIYFLRLINLV